MTKTILYLTPSQMYLAQTKSNLPCSGKCLNPGSSIVFLLLFKTLRTMLHLFRLIQLLRLDVLSEQIPPEEIEELAPTIRSVISGSHSKDLIEFFEGFAFGFGHEEENTEEADDCVENGGLVNVLVLNGSAVKKLFGNRG